MATRETTRSRKREALDLSDDGWEVLERRGMGLRANIRDAENLFRKALQQDPSLADAYNGLGNTLYDRGRFAEAQAMYRTGLEKARAELGSDGIYDYAWWEDLDTRPYMRARHGLGLSYWQQGKFEDAIGEFKELLKRNPNDNQGVRFLLGGAYHIKGDLRAALSYYRSAEETMLGDRDPTVEFNLGLLLAQMHRYEPALFQWRSAFFQNPYIPLVVLSDGRHRFGRVDKEIFAAVSTAVSYWFVYRHFWRRRRRFRTLLNLVYTDTDVQSELRALSSLEMRLGTERSAQRRRLLVKEVQVLKDPKRIEGTNKAIVEHPQGVPAWKMTTRGRPVVLTIPAAGGNV